MPATKPGPLVERLHRASQVEIICRTPLRLKSKIFTGASSSPSDRKANDRTRKLFNAAVFERMYVKNGQLCYEQYRPPFDRVFTVPEF